MKEIYPDYADDVAFYAVGTHSRQIESIDRLESFRQERGYPWPVANPVGPVLADLHVTIQSTKIAFDSQGLITYRDGMGRGDPETWRDVFGELAKSQ